MNDLSHSHKNKNKIQKGLSHFSKNSLFNVLLSEYLYVTIVHLFIYLFFLKRCLCENFKSHEFV